MASILFAMCQVCCPVINQIHICISLNGDSFIIDSNWFFIRIIGLGCVVFILNGFLSAGMTKYIGTR